MVVAAHKPGRGRQRLGQRMSALRRPGLDERPLPPRRPARLAGRLTASMRRPAASARARAAPLAPTSAPSLAVLAWNRLAFGPRAGDLEAFAALGATDDERLAGLLDRQLDPGSIDDGAADARIATSGYTTLGKSLEQLWRDHVQGDPSWRDRIRPIVETTFATFLRAVYSRRQLFEVLVDFWHNHFSVYGWESLEAATWVHYDRDVVRAHALGNFRSLLEAVATSTPMLLYLDNWRNSADGPNENYARELMELHTLGDENYFGAVPRAQVPLDASGMQTGFVDEDVFAVTRCLTGWSLDGDPWWKIKEGNGTFRYRAEWHDEGSKNVLGVQLPAAQGPQVDGRTVLDLLAFHPGTARFVCRKLARKLVGDFPPESLVESAAATFRAHRHAPDQIARTVRAIVLSPEFRVSWGQKIKRPFETVVSALRAGGADFPFIEDDPDAESFDWRFYSTGHHPFAWHPPNGYPDFGEAWVSSGPRVMTWRLTNWLADVEDDAGAYRMDALAQTPAHVRSATALADFWIDRVFGRPLPAAERQEVIEFMSQGHNPDFDLPLDTDRDTRERLQAMVGLLFLSPEFQWR